MTIEGVREWQGGNLQTSYPFVSDGLPDQVGDTDIRSVIAEAVIVSDEPANTRIYLNEIRLSDSDPQAQSIDLRYVSNDSSFFDSALPGVVLKTTVWGDWMICEWTQPEPNYDRVVKLLVYVPAISRFTYPLTLSPTPVFVTSCLTDPSRQIDTLAIRNPPFTVETPTGGQIILSEGYNTSLEVATDNSGLRTKHVVTVNAIPGAGAGLAPGCETDDPYPGALRSFGNATADANGNVALGSNTGCYWVGRPVSGGHASLVPATLQLTNNCHACCSCSDYVNVYNMLTRVADGLADIVRRFPALQDSYTRIVSRIQNRAACGVPPCTLKLYSLPGWLVGFQAVVVNTSNEDLCDVWLRFVISSPALMVYIPESFYVTQVESGGRRIHTAPELFIDPDPLYHAIALPPYANSFVLLFRYYPRIPPKGTLVISAQARADRSCRQEGWPVQCDFAYGSGQYPSASLSPVQQTVALKESHPR